MNQKLNKLKTSNCRIFFIALIFYSAMKYEFHFEGLKKKNKKQIARRFCKLKLLNVDSPKIACPFFPLP